MQYTIQELTQTGHLKNDGTSNIIWGNPSGKYPTWINTYHPNQRLNAAREEIAAYKQLYPQGYWNGREWVYKPKEYEIVHVKNDRPDVKKYRCRDCSYIAASLKLHYKHNCNH